MTERKAHLVGKRVLWDGEQMDDIRFIYKPCPYCGKTFLYRRLNPIRHPIMPNHVKGGYHGYSHCGSPECSKLHHLFFIKQKMSQYKENGYQTLRVSVRMIIINDINNAIEACGHARTTAVRFVFMPRSFGTQLKEYEDWE